MRILTCAMLIALPLTVLAQDTNANQSTNQGNQSSSNPIFKVQVVSRSIPAVSYRNRSGWTKIDFQGTSIAPKAHGTADVNSRLGNMEIKVDIKDLPAPTTYGSEFLTYVLWAITPEGHAVNLGEVVVDDHGNYKGDLTTSLQAFGLIVTAEPYWGVRMPSDVVVMENVTRSDTKGKEEVINASYELLPRGQYTYHVPESQLHPVDMTSKKNPQEIYEAENAIQIARYARADQYAQDTFQNATQLLNQAEDYQMRKQWKPAIMTAKEAVQKAEDARQISLKRQEQEALDQERQQAAAREAAERARAEQETAAAAEASKQRQQAEQQAQLEAQQRAAAEQAKAEADAARAQAASEAQKAQAAADEANRLRQQAENERNALREQLLQQFNAILQTRETTRGLVINMSDVLFDIGKYSLKEPAREKLAKLSGIILSHPGLNLRVEGYTDITGSDAFNQKLSEQRADTVREFLINQGLTPDSISSVGYGKAYPVASNDTASGRAMNRRVELVVSGEIIGVRIGQPPTEGPGAGSQPLPPAQQQQPQ
ncbi:MAG: OmpA family protein [Acidobacteriaceae bacterium]|nr:OmpA family protein [Acidobacteriaceae bacterium]